MPIVIKADGLAAGKGVVIAETPPDAEAAIDACFSGAFGQAGEEGVVVLEDEQQRALVGRNKHQASGLDCP